MPDIEIEQRLERREPVTAVRVTKICKECGADMKFNGSVLACHPPLYQHSCSADEWHGTENFDRKYPAIVYEGLV